MCYGLTGAVKIKLGRKKKKLLSPSHIGVQKPKEVAQENIFGFQSHFKRTGVHSFSLYSTNISDSTQ